MEHGNDLSSQMSFWSPPHPDNVVIKLCRHQLQLLRVVYVFSSVLLSSTRVSRVNSHLVASGFGFQGASTPKDSRRLVSRPKQIIRNHHSGIVSTNTFGAKYQYQQPYDMHFANAPSVTQKFPTLKMTSIIQQRDHILSNFQQAGISES